MSDHGTLVMYSLMSGQLRPLGLRVQRDHLIRESNCRVDPGNSRNNLLESYYKIL